MIVKRDIRSVDAYNDVAGVHIVYSTSFKTNDVAESVSGRLELDDERLGVITVERDGRLYVSFDKANYLTLEERREIVSTILADANEILNSGDQTSV